MDGTGQLPASEQPGEKEQAGVKQCKAGHRQQHQASRGDPVIDTRSRRVAIDGDGISAMNTVIRVRDTGVDSTRLDFMHTHDRSPASRLAFTVCRAEITVTPSGTIS